MHDVPVEIRALRRTILGGLLGFVVGFVAVAGGCLYLILHVTRSHGWTDIFGNILSFAQWPFIGGLVVAAAFVQILSKWHYSHGVYRCIHCNRSLRAAGVPCSCQSRSRHRPQRRRSFLRHYRKRIATMIMIWFAVLPLATLLRLVAPGRADRSLLTDLLTRHGAICLMAAACIVLLNLLLEIFRLGKSFRLRSTIFVRALGGWGILMVIALAR